MLNLSPRDVLPKAEVYGQNELLAIVQDDSAKAALLGRFLPDDSDARKQLGTLTRRLQKNREEIDALELKITDMAAKLDQLPALLDREKSFRKLGLENELSQVKVRESQRAYVVDLDQALSTMIETASELQAEIDDLAMSTMSRLRSFRMSWCAPRAQWMRPQSSLGRNSIELRGRLTKRKVRSSSPCLRLSWPLIRRSTNCRQ